MKQQWIWRKQLLKSQYDAIMRSFVTRGVKANEKCLMWNCSYERRRGAKLVNKYNEMVPGGFRLKLNDSWRTELLTTDKVKQ